MVEFFAVDKTHTCLSNLAFEYTFVTCVTEYADIHRVALVKVVVKRYVVDKILREVFVSISVGRIVTADDNLKSVVKE